MTLYFKALNAGPSSEAAAWLTSRGPLYKGEANLCRERWDFWTSQFFKVKDEVDEEASKMAQQAIGAIEKGLRGHEKRDMDIFLGTHRRFKKPRTK
ncbi:hypothetical protein V8E54_001456 [Elaphomyces granulatus]